MSKEERNYGIDTLRVVAMFFVIILHSLAQGGLISSVAVESNQYKLVWLFEIIAYCAVDIFALISGYVSYNKGTKYKNFINLWFEVVFYSLFFVILFQIINPSLVTKYDYLKSFLPIINNTYWYFTAYAGLFLFKPILDKGIDALDKAQLKKLFIILFIAFSIFDTIFNRFSLFNGYTVIWLVILYIMGAIISKCEIGKNIKLYKSIIGIIILVLITYLVKIYAPLELLLFKNSLNITISNNILISYISPTILGIAILLVISFSKFRYNNFSKKIITFLSSSAFCIYLLNTHYLVWDNFMKDLFKPLADKNILIIGSRVVGFAIIFVICSILIDKIRILIFKLLRINKLSEKIGNNI